MVSQPYITPKVSSLNRTCLNLTYLNRTYSAITFKNRSSFTYFVNEIMKNTNKITNKTTLIGSLILILALILITACSSSDSEQTIADQNQDNNQNQVKIPNQYDQITESQPSTQVAEETPETPVYTKEVAELIEKSSGLTSYSYLYTSSTRNENGNYLPSNDYEAQVKNNKIKKLYSEPLKLNSSVFYSEVYLDTEQETAYVTCDANTVLCKENKLKIYFIRYPAVKIKTLPLDLLKEIPAAAEIVGKENINDRQATIIKYVNNAGNKEKLYLDSYSGFPLKQESFILEDDEEVLLQRNTFNLISLNNIKTADVNLPDNYAFS